jgi:hypothetical protein
LISRDFTWVDRMHCRGARGVVNGKVEHLFKHRDAIALNSSPLLSYTARYLSKELFRMQVGRRLLLRLCPSLSSLSVRVWRECSVESVRAVVIRTLCLPFDKLGGLFVQVSAQGFVVEE